MSGRGGGKKKPSNPPKIEKDTHAHHQKSKGEKKPAEQEKAKVAHKAPVGGGGIKKSEKK